MDTRTNHLVTSQQLDSMDQSAKEAYEPIPNHLIKAAVLKLGGTKEATISKHSGGRLSKWAAQRRKEKRRTEKLSRKRNRKG
jgi:hypothetical protein